MAQVRESWIMQTINDGYRGLSLLMDLNWDLVLYAGTITLALAGATYIGSLGL
ncbi:hypothetical protein R5H30_07075 [Sulfitobacter sp. D35]|uniref:hypothetical protein n=1 Tax=Sulfitobacter sp. D35 TaxID=3083252 RepID=UPI00296F4B9E|nr:hypothetical protein [Sulfitobacter sp. D35]MDW4497736.1 hypothetical protein [Sulfitobacter sp. D35]